MSDKPSSGDFPVLFSNRLSRAFDLLEQQIRERAYQIFLDRGDEPGDSMADWLQAQSEMLKPVELEVRDQKSSVVAECNLTGFSPEEIEIEVENGVLKVFGSHRDSITQRVAGGTESRSESVYFFQSAQLPADIDLDAAHARLFKNGKLKVTLPKVGSRPTKKAPAKAAKKKSAAKGAASGSKQRK
jgi:HSP20 family molecular chaperone IbpA